jgi:hypothetical protein
MSGKFWTDWLYSGNYWYFCCNSQVSSLGRYDDTFSSVFHYRAVRSVHPPRFRMSQRREPADGEIPGR